MQRRQPAAAQMMRLNSSDSKGLQRKDERGSTPQVEWTGLTLTGTEEPKCGGGPPD